MPAESPFNINVKETISSGPGIGIVTIYNGFCRFNPSTSRGRYIFVSQTLLLSFTPLLILLVQNSFGFNDMMLTGEKNLEQSKLVSGDCEAEGVKRSLVHFSPRRRAIIAAAVGTSSSCRLSCSPSLRCSSCSSRTQCGSTAWCSPPRRTSGRTSW